jgi:hypothetical protein
MEQGDQVTKTTLRNRNVMSWGCNVVQIETKDIRIVCNFCLTNFNWK